MFSLDGKIAVVTGSAQGIGLSIVKRFIKAGAKVVMADIQHGARKTAEELGCRFVLTDVSKEEDVKNLMLETKKMYNKIDICVNNAGVNQPEVPLEKTQKKVADQVLHIDLYGVLWGLKYAPHFMNDGGSIINVSSLGGIATFPGYGPYCAAKAGVISLTQTAAVELADRNIRVNCINPGTVGTPMPEAPENAFWQVLTKYNYPLGRMCEPGEVAALIHFLAADDCKYITGEAINIDGGFSAGMGTNKLERLLRD